MSYLYYVLTMPGLETLAFSEIRASIPDAELVKFARGIALFRTASAPDDLLLLRTVEDVYFALSHIKGLGSRQDALRVLHSATLNADIAGALKLWRRVHYGGQPKSWRVVSQKSGSHEFRRVDAGEAIASALKKTLPHTLRFIKDKADVEFWLWLHGSEALIGLRLSDATLRHRQYKQEHLPASLRPTVAAAMSWLARPTPEDIVLDPLCGAGTIVIERALMAPLEQAIGSDVREKAVAIARRNAQAANIEARWRVWDARSLPLEQGSVTRIITNLPFGKQVGNHETNAKLYAALLREFGRVLTPDGLLVALTSEDRLWDTLLHDAGWDCLKKVVLVVLGQPASIFVAAQRS
jgi:tRNA (guanine6-N2)-methyltransferase